MDTTFNPVPAAELLHATWLAGDLLTELPAAIRPRSLSEGYDIQDCLIERLGEPVAGWKLGVGSPKGKQQAGTSRAIVGRVLQSRLYRSGDTVPLPNRAPTTVEFEIAFVLGRDIAPGDVIAKPLDAVSATHVVYEFVLARFVDRRAVGWPSFAADDAGFCALVLGPKIDPAQIDAIARSLIVSADGKEAARAAVGLDAIDPVAALGEMFEHARERGMTLTKSMIISTGTLSQPFNIPGTPAQLTATFNGGKLSAFTSVPNPTKKA